jgi:hypothetical protein
MSTDDIRHQKGIVLLEYQEAQARVHSAHAQLKHLSGTLERIARLLDPDEERPLVPKAIRAPNLNALQDGAIREALEHTTAVRLATEMADALKALDEAQGKKRELGM